MIDKIRFGNLLHEAAASVHNPERALLCLDQARLMLIPPVLPRRPAPEMDPARSPLDRADWVRAQTRG